MNYHQQWIIISSLAAYVHISCQISTSNSTHYVAAIAKYNPAFERNNIEFTLKENTNAYVKHIELAKNQNADIIIFPEYGLTSINLIRTDEYIINWTIIIPSPADHYLPCLQDKIEIHKVLRKISCAARQNQIYVAINIAEKSFCTEDSCPKDKVFYYNTNVVFDRTGTIIARYRKIHLSVWEAEFSKSVSEVVTFNTDFGVQFGIFTCCDVASYCKPTLPKLIKINKVTDFVCLAACFFESTVQIETVQVEWSFANDVNLLVSHYTKFTMRNDGMHFDNFTRDGMYFGRERENKGVLFSTGQETLLISKVPKKNKNKF